MQQSILEVFLSFLIFYFPTIQKVGRQTQKISFSALRLGKKHAIIPHTAALKRCELLFSNCPCVKIFFEIPEDCEFSADLLGKIPAKNPLFTPAAVDKNFAKYQKF